jgi:hypothetical protein
VRALYCVLVLVLSAVGHAADLAPKEIVSAFFGPDGIPDKSRYYTGEMLSHFKENPTLGQSLPPGTRVSIRSLPSSGPLLTFAVTLSEAQLTQDWYAYLRRDGNLWKLEAVRTLALTGISQVALEELRRKSKRTPDEDWSLKNLELMFMTDFQLKAFVSSNLSRLNGIVGLVRGGRTTEARDAAKRLHISSVEKAENGIVRLTIGGVVDNSVGFMLVPNRATVPAMDPSNYIYMERAVQGWYVFKTT